VRATLPFGEIHAWLVGAIIDTGGEGHTHHVMRLNIPEEFLDGRNVLAKIPLFENPFPDMFRAAAGLSYDSDDGLAGKAIVSSIKGYDAQWVSLESLLCPACKALHQMLRRWFHHLLSPLLILFEVIPRP
jgi:hypothetical protein